MIVALQCSNVDNLSVLILTLQHSGWTTAYVNPIFSAPILSLICIFHECPNTCPSCCSVNFRTTSMSWDLREVLGNVNEFTILLGQHICWDLALVHLCAFPVTVCSPGVCARGRPQLDDCNDNATPGILGSISVRIHCSAYCTTPRFSSNQDLEFPGCRLFLKFLQKWVLHCLSLVRSWRDREKLLVISNLENSLALGMLCMKEWNCFRPQLELLVIRFDHFPPFWQMLPVRKLCENGVSRLSASCSNESPRACGMFRWFCPIHVNFARVRNRCPLRRPIFSVTPLANSIANAKVNCLPLWSWWESSWEVVISSSFPRSVPSENASANLGCAVWHKNMSAVCNTIVSDCPLGVRWNFRSQRIFWRGPQEQLMSWLELGRKCCHFGVVQTSFCIAFLCPSFVVEHWHEYEPIFNQFRNLAR